MRRFVSYIVFFTISLTITILLINQIQYSDEFLIHKTANTSYNKIAWNIDVINNSPNKIKEGFVFFGSSLTQGGISDSVFTSMGYKCLNMGVNHSGNALSLYFLKRITPLQPKSVYLLKRKTPRHSLHPMTPLLYKPFELLNDGQIINTVFLSYLLKRTKYTIEYVIFNILEKNPIEVVPREYGLRSSLKNGDVMFNDINLYNELVSLPANNHTYRHEKNNNSFFMRIKLWRRKLIFKYPQLFGSINSVSQKMFLLKARDICDKNNIFFNKIYIPIAGDCIKHSGYQSMIYRESTSDRNILCLDDFLFLKNKSYWQDKSHLNRIGAEIFSNKLIEKLNERTTFTKIHSCIVI